MVVRRGSTIFNQTGFEWKTDTERWNTGFYIVLCNSLLWSQKLLSSAFYLLKCCTQNRTGPNGMGVFCAIHSRSSPQDDDQGERDKEVALTQIRVFNLWITCSVRKKLLWALQYANVSPRCRQRPISERQLSRVFVAVPRCADFVHFTGGTGRLSSCGLWMFQISTMANFQTGVYELLKLFDSSRQ